MAMVLAATATAVWAVNGRDAPLPDVMYDDSPARIGIETGYYNQRYEFAHGPLRTTSGPPVRLTGARVVKATPGIVVEDIKAINTCDGTSELVYSVAGTVTDSFPNVVVHPIADAEIGPAQRRCWYLMVGVHVTKPGTYSTEGIELTYARGSRTGRQRLRYRFGIVAVKPGPDPRDKTPGDAVGRP